jgi:mycofactocin precursor
MPGASRPTTGGSMTVTTSQETTPADPGDQHAPVSVAAPTTQLVTADLLVEDVSIDGMCGVY